MGMGNIVPRDSASSGYFTSSGHSKDRIGLYLSLVNLSADFLAFRKNFE
ncbi:hypothetical protein LEP1GSC016_3208 [Leptospira borgpetersenii serovar Hardjo-bovis str. Sponselee]|uniref:Uncharacterized protein n=6 Tax=Leptospira borgpetersenii TaxID=174 RepID=M3HL23_LEPBO|nr:hypothetical protein LEP1GSC128_0503 [Leptospira borgpetersenii str. 200801926]EKQ93312.1 hypothetical protein LEP1GSC101_3569 [Leptospira borgpetersenii str. UI 09149]EKQ98364.1 hypothetical protein LEP1GSC121_3056 [Leptospira borgpetersenii serovar Castellonis str. 200801910]EMF98800.1 hypothetical protein LEP1GSC123_3141 [Leptospira borgpetersenii str. 200701203]EMJ80541.1 hypothetical protein LEP1GSC016_3208 [Leptospira borgpetersenii serovar Hardjo-bovis str. Sponselee]EMK11823.1 hypot